MITIKQILEAPVGERFGGIELTVKTAKKWFQVGEKWIHQVVLTDATGDILADVKLGFRKLPTVLIRGETIKIIVAEVQAAVPGKQNVQTGKKLYVDQFRRPPGKTADEHLAEEEEQIELWKVEAAQIVRSKIKCLLVSSKVRTGADIHSVLLFAEDSDLVEIIDEIVKG